MHERFAPVSFVRASLRSVAPAGLLRRPTLSGFSRTVTSVVSGFSRTVTSVVSGFSRTSEG